MNLYLISQNDNPEIYDVFRNAVVAAPSPAIARKLHPGRDSYDDWDESNSETIEVWERLWASHPDKVEVKLIGIADPKYTKPCVICSDFNAG